MAFPGYRPEHGRRTGGRYGALRLRRRGLGELDMDVLEVREAITASGCGDREGCCGGAGYAPQATTSPAHERAGET